MCVLPPLLPSGASQQSTHDPFVHDPPSDSIMWSEETAYSAISLTVRSYHATAAAFGGAAGGVFGTAIV
jgi:hypothetical protein